MAIFAQAEQDQVQDRLAMALAGGEPAKLSLPFRSGQVSRDFAAQAVDLAVRNLSHGSAFGFLQPR